MREIKFRAWNKKEHAMKYFTLENASAIGSNWFGGFETEDGGIYSHDLPDDGLSENDEYVITQYTGLKDKNGKEIYEGDIIQWWNGINKPQVVETTNGGWNPFIDDCQTDGSWHYKVIGNIYENPELLETSNV